MKKMMFTLIALLTMSAAANAMSYEQARNEALFLTDKMAYELNLTDAQYEAAYEINLDYLMGVTSVDDVYGIYWERRNIDLSYILYQWQWDAYLAASYFYRPLYWSAGHWHFGIYARYTVRDYFYFGRPHFFVTYRGGHSWHMNGNRSYYHGRADHFRPALGNNRQHFGMRSRYDNGEFRDRSGRAFDNNRHGRAVGENGNRRFGENRSGRSLDNNRERSFGNDRERSLGNDRDRGTRFGSSTRVTAGRQENNTPTQRNFGGSNSPTQRNFGGSSSTTQRSNAVPQMTTPQRSTTTPQSSATVPQRSSSSSSASSPMRQFGGSRASGSSSSSRSNSSSRSSSAGSSRSGSSSGHGHFGGRR